MMETLFDSQWKETKISDILPDLKTSQEEVNGAEDDDENYELEGVDKSKPNTLFHDGRSPDDCAQRNR